MARVIKTISLDKVTAQIAENVPNFSEWVRTQLLMHHTLEGGEPIHIQPIRSLRNFTVQIPVARDDFGRPIIESYDTKRCNPHHAKGRCPVCWPPHLSIEEHTLEIARLYREGILDPLCEGEE